MHALRMLILWIFMDSSSAHCLLALGLTAQSYLGLARTKMSKLTQKTPVGGFFAVTLGGGRPPSSVEKIQLSFYY